MGPRENIGEIVMQKSFLNKVVGVAALALVVSTAPWAVASPSETGAIASDLNAVSNPGFDAKGAALQKVIMKLNGQAPQGVPSIFGKPTKGSNNGISYHGGPVMTSGIKINIVWYGNWSNTKKGIITNLIGDLNASPHFNINTTYKNASNSPVQNSLTLGQQYPDNYSLGNGGTTALTDANIWTIVNTAAGTPNGSAIKDTNAITLVLTSSDVKKSGFLTSYCGWHTYGSLAGVSVKYSFVGDPGFSSSCAGQTTYSPNGDIGADAMASVITHEIEEAATDPELNAWYDTRGYENADKCAWKFGTTSTLNNFKYNMTMNGRKYYIQQNWVNAAGGYCALTY